MIKKIHKFILELCILVIYILSSIFFIYLLLGSTFRLLLPELNLFDKSLVTASHFELINLSFIVFIFLGVGIFFKRLLKKMSFVKPLALDKNQIAGYLISSLFLSFFFLKDVYFFRKFPLAAQLVLTIFFFFYLPQLVEFFSSLDITYFMKFTRPQFPGSKFSIPRLTIMHIRSIRLPKLEFSISGFRNYIEANFIFWTKLIRKIVFSIIYLALIVGLIGLIVFLITRQVNNYLDYQRELRRKLYILDITPKKTTLAQEEVVTGYNFGFKTNDKFRLISEFGSVDTNFWTNDKIIFTVPLHWTEGKTKIWVERSIKDNSESAVIRSNEKDLEILPRFDFYPEQVDYDSPGFLYWRIFYKKIKKIIYLGF